MLTDAVCLAPRWLQQLQSLQFKQARRLSATLVGLVIAGLHRYIVPNAGVRGQHLRVTALIHSDDVSDDVSLLACTPQHLRALPDARDM